MSLFISTSVALLQKVEKLRDRSLSACLVNNSKVSLFSFLCSLIIKIKHPLKHNTSTKDRFGKAILMYDSLINLLRSNWDSRQINPWRCNSSSFTKSYLKSSPIFFRDKKDHLGKILLGDGTMDGGISTTHAFPTFIV